MSGFISTAGGGTPSLVYNAIKARRPTVATMGESHGQANRIGYAIQYACMRYYNANITYDSRQFTAGVGRTFAVGGTTTTGTNGLTTQITQFQQYPTDIVFICSGNNDFPTFATVGVITTTVQTVAAQCFAAGAKAVIITGIPPYSGLNAAGLRSYNTIMKNWCLATNGAYFIDVTSVVCDLAAATGVVNYRGPAANGAYQSMTVDGTHISGYAARLIAPQIADIFKVLAPQRYPRANIPSGTYDPVNGPWAELLGDAGNCLGTAGIYLGGFDTGVAGKDSTSRLDIERGGTTLTSTNSIVVGATGERKQRMTPGGTYANSDTLQLNIAPTITNVNNSDATRLYDMECVIDLNGITGLSNIELRPGAGAAYSTIYGASTNTGCDNWNDATTENLFLYNLFPFPLSGNNPYNTIYFYFGGTRGLAGSIDVSRLSMMRVV